MDILQRFETASARFDMDPTPDNAETLLMTLEGLSGSKLSGVLRRIEKAKNIFLTDGRHGSEDNPI
jgi:hypothetical protein